MRKIEALPSGRYKVRFRHGVSRKTGRPLQASESFNTRRDAERFAKWLDALGPQGALDRLYDGEQAATTPTLDEVAADHIHYIDGAGEAHKVKSQRLWARTWSPRIGAVRADQVTRDLLVRALGDLAANGRGPGRGYSEKSLSNQRGLLYGVLERCVTKGYLAKNPGKKLKIPQVTIALDAEDDGDVDEMVCLAPAEFVLLDAAMTAHYKPLVRFMVGTGVRWGEVAVLRVGDLTLTGQPQVHIRRALKWSPDGQHRIGPPKTKRSKRKVALPTGIAEELREMVRGKAASDLVFTAPRGGRIHHRTFWSDHWRPAIWRAQHCPEHLDPACRCGTAHPKRCRVHEQPPPPCGCPGTLGPTPRIHDLRHTQASWLLGQGVPIHVVSARLGHQSIKTTVDTYGHLLPDAQLAAANAAELAFAHVPQIGG